MTTKTKRYILQKNDETNGPKLCAFFLTDKGCKNGSSCKFLHGTSTNEKKIEQVTSNPTKTTTATKPITTIIPASQPIVPPPIDNRVTTPDTTSTPHKSEKKKRKSSGDLEESHQKKQKSKNTEEGNKNTSTVSTPQSLVQTLPVTPFHPPTYRPADDDEDESSFLYFAVNTALTQEQIQTPDVTKKTPVDSSSHSNSISNFFLPAKEVKNITELNAHSEKVLKERKSAKKNKSPGKALVEQKPHVEVPVLSFPPQPVPSKQATLPTQATPFIPSTIAPVAPRLSTNQPPAASVVSTTEVIPVDPRASDWSKLVQQCANHSRFAKDYTFSTDSEWIQAKPYGEWAHSYPPIIAIDCEMCETIDPVTDAKNSNALIRVSVVNGINHSDVLLDSLVAPNWPISEMRTRIHGIAENNLKGVTFTLRHAQAFLMKVCSDQTIIVGHALHHDLRSLKFQHKCIIDTSYLYTIENEPNSLLSLRDIAKHLYDQQLSVHHDSVQDAQVALMLALHVKNNGTPPPIPRTSSHSSTIDETMLFVHRLPLSMNEDIIREMMITMTNIVPSIINPIHHSATTQQTPTGKTNVVFPSAAHANLCFETLPGLDRPDKGGRSQKRVYLKGGGYICVRKA